ncbi:magnesium transporter [Alcaligenes endophyticus]|uniref:Magnesium transporter MgtE n=1 Tax=Alcaligenes endophyticus TaxID=1929088 RepID=A0ABT8EL73_9BURK|nr:magnesium transporter [Alcaligenes endophyticus]MCX5590595.1 magnesium transporter [Alcaligenes endophyticus]MDN4122041.1 magnesium transporter [Alcaligenes endophyticus]
MNHAHTQRLEKVRQSLAQHDINTAQGLISNLPAADVAELLTGLASEETLILLGTQTPQKQAAVFTLLDLELQTLLAPAMGRQAVTQLFEHMDHHKRADLYKRLSASDRLALLPGLAHAEREDIRQLASYPEGTAGAIMTSAYASLTPELTTQQALDSLRLEAPDKETIYQCYVLNAERRLIGTVSLRELILAPANTLIAQLMTKEPISCQAMDSQDEAARLVAHYDLLALPVLNKELQIVGIITHDEALDAVAEGGTEDQLKLGAISSKGASLRHASISTLYRMRVGWLVILVFGNIFSGAGIAHFEDLIANMVALVFFLPLLVDSGGNAGSQSATLMVRALATGDVRAKDWTKLLGKELMVSLLLGISMAVAVASIGVVRGGMELAIIVALTMVTIVMVGSLIGMSLPFILTRLKLDPASASAPLITSICDAVGVLIYFNIANALLNLA